MEKVQMPKLTPLKDWICDSCGQTVHASSGAVEWIEAVGESPRDFRIVCNKNSCYHYTNHPHRADLPISSFIGDVGLQRFLSKLDVGPLLDPDGHGEPVPEMRSFVDTARRLLIPYYEEARLYFSNAISDGYFGDHNEVSIFLPSTCKAIIDRYS